MRRAEIHLLTRADDIRAVLGDEARFPAAAKPERVEGPLLTELSGLAHQRQRAMVMAGLGPDAVRSMRPFIAGQALELVDTIVGDAPRVAPAEPLTLGDRPRLVPAHPSEVADKASPDAPEQRLTFGGVRLVDLVAAFAVPLPRRVLGHMLGIAEGDQAELLGWSAEAGHESPADGGPLDAMLRASVGRGADESDLLRRMIGAEVVTAPTADEVVTQARFLTVAGLSTTTALLGDLLLSLAMDPSAEDALHHEPSKATAAVEEALRLRSPAPMISRVATVRTAVGSRKIEPGDVVVLDLRAAGRDATVFPDPQSYALERDRSAHHLAFGAGAHLCAGAQLARAIVGEAVQAITGRLRFAVADGWVPQRAGSLVSGALVDLVVDVEPREPLVDHAAAAGTLGGLPSGSAL